MATSGLLCTSSTTRGRIKMSAFKRPYTKKAAKTKEEIGGERLLLSCTACISNKEMPSPKQTHQSISTWSTKRDTVLT